MAAPVLESEVKVETETGHFAWADWVWMRQFLNRGCVCGWFSIPPGATQKQILSQFAHHLSIISAQHPGLFSDIRGI